MHSRSRPTMHICFSYYLSLFTAHHDSYLCEVDGRQEAGSQDQGGHPVSSSPYSPDLNPWELVLRYALIQCPEDNASSIVPDHFDLDE